MEWSASRRQTTPDTAGKDGVRRVLGEHLTPVEEGLAVVEWITRRHARFLDRLDERETRVGMELADDLPEERQAPHLVVGVPGLDHLGLGVPVADVCHR